MMDLLEPLRGNVELLSYVLFVAAPFVGAIGVGVWKLWIARRTARCDDHAPTGQPS